MREIEEIFKQIYLDHPKRELDKPHTKESLQDIFAYVASISDNPITKMFTESLDEETFFCKETDVAFYQHIAYLPADYHSHDFFEIACVLEGCCTNYIMDKEVLMHPGDICVIAPNTRHAVSIFSEDARMVNILIRTSTFEKSFFSVLSEDDVLSEFFARSFYQSKEVPYLIFQTGYDSEIRSFIDYLKDEMGRNRRYKKRMVNSILNAFFIVLLRNHDKDVLLPSLNKDSANENLIFMLRYLQENYTSVTLRYLASFFNYSERQVQRILREATGLSFTENIQKLKMTHAAQLLKNKNIPVTEIALGQGYSDASNFRHVFKKYYGMTPKEYRNQAASRQEMQD